MAVAHSLSPLPSLGVAAKAMRRWRTNPPATNTRQPGRETLVQAVAVVAPPAPFVVKGAAGVSGALGMCGHMSTLVSAWVVINDSAVNRRFAPTVKPLWFVGFDALAGVTWRLADTIWTTRHNVPGNSVSHTIDTDVANKPATLSTTLT